MKLVVLILIAAIPFCADAQSKPATGIPISQMDMDTATSIHSIITAIPANCQIITFFVSAKIHDRVIINHGYPNPLDCVRRFFKEAKNKTKLYVDLESGCPSKHSKNYTLIVKK